MRETTQALFFVTYMNSCNMIKPNKNLKLMHNKSKFKEAKLIIKACGTWLRILCEWKLKVRFQSFRGLSTSCWYLELKTNGSLMALMLREKDNRGLQWETPPQCIASSYIMHPKYGGRGVTMKYVSLHKSHSLLKEFVSKNSMSSVTWNRGTSRWSQT